MNSKAIILFFCLFQFLALSAQEPDSSQYTGPGAFEMMPVLNPWLNSTNPAGLQFNQLAPGRLNLKYHGESGDYKRVQQGDQLRNASFQMERYKKIEKTFFYGNFSYDKGFEHGCNYNLVNDPYRDTPYQLIDTTARDDIYDREFFTLQGDISTPIFRELAWGFSADMNVGMASQDRDPRPKNKVMNLDLSQGLLYASEYVSVGVNGLFSYYNEDIEVDIIKKNEQLVFFDLHGFDTYGEHEARSFNRLYERVTYGGEGQVNLKIGGLNSLFAGKFLYYIESADDGRKGGDASWSYIKNDAELEGNQIEFFNASTFRHGNIIHTLNASYLLRYGVGTEFLQRLEQVSEFGTQDWIQHWAEEKYACSKYDIDLSYAFLLMKDKYRKNLMISLGVDFYGSEQAYYLPDLQESFKNRIYSAAVSKSFYMGRHELSLAADIRVKKPMNFFRDYDVSTYLGENLLLPDFYYLSSNYIAPGLDAYYTVSLNKIFNKFFLHSNVKLYRGRTGNLPGIEDASRMIFNVSTGVIF